MADQIKPAANQGQLSEQAADFRFGRSPGSRERSCDGFGLRFEKLRCLPAARLANRAGRFQEAGETGVWRQSGEVRHPRVAGGEHRAGPQSQAGHVIAQVEAGEAGPRGSAPEDQLAICCARCEDLAVGGGGQKRRTGAVPGDGSLHATIIDGPHEELAMAGGDEAGQAAFRGEGRNEGGGCDGRRLTERDDARLERRQDPHHAGSIACGHEVGVGREEEAEEGRGGREGVVRRRRS